jgi:outer membrane receptor for ferrienterochelin and colicins
MNHIADRTDIRPGQTPRNWDYNNYAGEIQLSQLAGKSQILTLGGEYRQNNLESTEVGEQDENIYSGFLQDEIELFDAAVLVLAGRVDHHDLWGYEFNPKGSLLYNLTQQTKIRLNAGRAFLAPALDDLYKIQPHYHVSYWIVGNPDLEPETSVGYSLDLEHNWSSEVLGRVSFFRNDIDNMISSRQDGTYIGGQPVMKAYNINEAFSQGYEVDLQFSPLKNLYGSIAYTYSQMEDKSIGKQIQNMPKHTGKMNAQYNNAQYQFGLHADVQYIGAMYTDSKLTVESRDYLIANAKITKAISNSLGVFLAVDNMFNETTSPENSKYFQMSRLWTMGLNFKL